MRQLHLHPLSKLANHCLLPALVASALACGSSDEDARDPDTSSSGGASAGSGATPGPATNGTNAAGTPSAEDIAALTDALGMAAGQVQAACGATFERCEATPGCNEILTCAARNACSGADCYCQGEGCAMPGPCRSVIESAPGARAPDPSSSNPSLGPASDAARAVGNCLLGLGGGGLPPGTTPTPLPSAPAGGGDAGASEPDAG